MKSSGLCALFLVVLTSLPASATVFDTMQNLLNPDSKEGKLLSGAAQVISSSKDIDYPTERNIGESLSLEGLQRFGNPVKNESLQRYVNLVGTAVASNSKRATIPYQFAVLDSPVQNAFAVPGGIIFVSRALVATLDNEAELAAVLAHEVGHVSAKHALKTIQRTQLLQGAGTVAAASVGGDKGKQYAAAITGLQSALFDKGLDQTMEFEADLAAMETCYRTGYDPSGMIRVLEKLQKLEATSKDKKGSWFSTHPPLSERIARLKAQLKKYPDYAALASVRDRFVKQTKMK
jgi:beta-barrel assembly-enhancing protease